jgi:hypothetical protein
LSRAALAAYQRIYTYISHFKMTSLMMPKERVAKILRSLQARKIALIANIELIMDMSTWVLEIQQR